MNEGTKQQRDVLVYQFGKVGSTSIVRTLNRIPNVKAYQSHFLGQVSLQFKLNQLLQPDLHPHFVKHGEGQLLENIKLTRLVNAYLQGLIEERELVVVSLARSPIDWYCSQMIQELEGYLSDFRKLSMAKPETKIDQVVISKALTLIKIQIKEALVSIGGLSRPKFKFELLSEFFPLLEKEKDPLNAEIYIRHIRAFLRPFFWFQSLVKPVFGFTLSDIETDNQYFFEKNFPWGKYFIYRYEDLNSGFQRMTKKLGYKQVKLLKENISAEKPFFQEMTRAFNDWMNDSELQSLISCDYTEKFGY